MRARPLEAMIDYTWPNHIWGGQELMLLMSLKGALLAPGSEVSGSGGGEGKEQAQGPAAQLAKV